MDLVQGTLSSDFMASRDSYLELVRKAPDLFKVEQSSYTEGIFTYSVLKLTGVTSYDGSSSVTITHTMKHNTKSGYIHSLITA